MARRRRNCPRCITSRAAFFRPSTPATGNLTTPSRRTSSHNFLGGDHRFIGKCGVDLVFRSNQKIQMI
jgi:hypothetical protein